MYLIFFCYNHCENHEVHVIYIPSTFYTKQVRVYVGIDI